MYFGLNTINIQAQFARFTFYGMLLLASLGSLNTTMIRHGLPTASKNVTDWDENFEWWHLGLIIVGVSSIYTIKGVLAGATSSIAEPWPATTQMLVPTLMLSIIPQYYANLIQQIFWQTFVVGTLGAGTQI